MKPTVEIINHCPSIPISNQWCDAWATCALEVIELTLKHHALGNSPPLAQIDNIDVALVDDLTSSRVHQDFMDIAGPTDVITFDHGEIVIGLEVAQRQADNHREPLPREIFRYLVHGILHLAGHRDASTNDRTNMEKIQESLVTKFWPQLEQHG